ncbi:MAG: hypothetical protein HN948_10155 [Clostridia bacterium]|jgi:hypothetical protein|nr:hypothetical protein [Clostridia bacterium]MBT7123356.1 hypothetical protein [Clostridia bacterium]
MGKKKRKKFYIWTSIIVVLLLAASILSFLFKSEETQLLEWLSYLFMNLAVGTVITAFFIYFGKSREREYQLNTSKRELGQLVTSVNMSISGIAYALKIEKEMRVEAFKMRKRVSINREILSIEEPKLFDWYESLENKCDKLEELFKNTVNDSKTEVIVGEDERKAIEAVQEICYDIADELNIFIGS